MHGSIKDRRIAKTMRILERQRAPVIGAPNAADASTSKPVTLAGAPGNTGRLVLADAENENVGRLVLADAENVGRLAMDDAAGSEPNVPIPGGAGVTVTTGSDPPGLSEVAGSSPVTPTLAIDGGTTGNSVVGNAALSHSMV